MSEKPLKLRRPYPDGDGFRNLQKYIDALDRDPPPVFVGRQDVIGFVEREVTRCRSNTVRDACFTIAFQGAPGSGKTSLLTELETRLGSTDGSGGPVTVVNLGGRDMASASSVAGGFIEAYTGRKPDNRDEVTTTVGGKASLLEILSGTVSRSAKKRTIEQQIQDTRGIWNAILAYTKVDVDDSVFILMVDEAQLIDKYDATQKTSESPVNDIVVALHRGLNGTQGLKIIPIFAGLSNTEDVLEERGISRIRGSPIQLGALTSSDSHELVSSWMRHDEFEFENLFSDKDIARVSSIVSVASEGWPRHTNSYLREIGRSLLEQHDDDLTIDLNAVLERGHDDRLAYYGRRVKTAQLGKYALAICDAAKGSSDGIIEVDALHAIAETRHGLDEAESKSCHARAVKAGVLERESIHNENRFKFPIPSLFTYMQCDRDEQEFKKRMREQMDANSHLWTEPKGLTR